MEQTTEAFDVMVALLVLVSPFVIAGLVIGYLVRNKRAEHQTKRNMEDRLDIALAEQRLQNMKREQALEDQLHEQRQRRLTNHDDEVEYVDVIDEVSEDEALEHKAPSPQVRRRIVKRLR